jgi:hypothetical protein
MYTVFIYRNGEHVGTLTEQTSDEGAFRYLLKHQSQSVDYALRYGGWAVVMEDTVTGERTKLLPYSKTK